MSKTSNEWIRLHPEAEQEIDAAFQTASANLTSGRMMVPSLGQTVGCAECGKDIILGETDPDTLVDHPVFKCGELAYIEIVHKSCDRFRAFINAGGTLD